MCGSTGRDRAERENQLRANLINQLGQRSYVSLPAVVRFNPNPNHDIPTTRGGLQMNELRVRPGNVALAVAIARHRTRLREVVEFLRIDRRERLGAQLLDQVLGRS